MLRFARAEFTEQAGIYFFPALPAITSPLLRPTTRFDFTLAISIFISLKELPNLHTNCIGNVSQAGDGRRINTPLHQSDEVN